MTSGGSNSVNLSVFAAYIYDVWPGLRAEYADRNIFNCDETGLFYKMLPNRKCQFKGISGDGSKLLKERLTYFDLQVGGEKRENR